MKIQVYASKEFLPGVATKGAVARCTEEYEAYVFDGERWVNRHENLKTLVRYALDEIARHGYPLAATTAALREMVGHD